MLRGEEQYELSARGVLLRTKGKNMKAKEKKISDELRTEYDFDYSKAVRGKYYKRLLSEGANVVMLEPDVAKSFTDSDAVNKALRSLLDLTKTTERLTKKSSGRRIAAH
jgi:hypothetical protein